MGDSKPKVNIFVAASTQRRAEAQELINALLVYQSRHFEACGIPSWDKSPGPFKLDVLFRSTSTCDFAAIFLNDDDLNKERNDSCNCLYETGLFTGALGDPKRCFLVTGGDRRLLPTDLEGLIPVDISDGDYRKAANLICQAIEERVAEEGLRAIRGIRRRTLTLEELIEKEVPKDAGGALVGDTHVFVNTARPFEERGEEFAKRVVQNISNKIEYCYVFEAHGGHAATIGKLLVNLALAGRSIDETIRKMLAGIKIYFVPHRVGLGIQYCIHNAQDYNHAVCYLRVPQPKSLVWIEWAYANEAVAIAEEIQRMQRDEYENRIFRSTLYYNLDDEPCAFKKLLHYEIMKQFEKKAGTITKSDLHHLVAACFGVAFI